MRPASKVVLAALATSVAAGGASAGAQTTVYQQPPVYEQPAGEQPLFAPVSPRPTTPNNPDAVSLSVQQLLINQRIAQAAVRRANAVQEWLDAGIMNRDLAGGAFEGQDFDPRSVTTRGTPPHALTVPLPRPVTAAPATTRNVRLSLDVRQLTINQRISAAAVRRSNALARRLGELTGGDLREGAVTIEKLRSRTGIARAIVVADPPAASRTIVAAGGASGDRFTLSRTQLLINQRISQAAVLRSNVLVDRVRAGLSGDNFRDGAITASALASDLRTR